MTIGDIFAVVAVILVTSGAWAATVLLAALFVPARVQQAKAQITAAPVRCVLRGLGLLIVGAIPALVIGSHPGPLRLVGFLFWGALALTAAVGSAGAVRLLADRITETGSVLSPFAALTRGAFLYVSAGLLPLVGWFVITPLALLLSLGAAVSRTQQPQTVVRTTPQDTAHDLAWKALS